MPTARLTPDDLRRLGATVGPSAAEGLAKLRAATPAGTRGGQTVHAVAVDLAVRVKSEANLREHWAAKKRRGDEQGDALRFAVAGVPLPPLPAVVTWTKLGGRRMDSDNLAGAFKALRDALSRVYGVDDADGSGLRWEYDQRPGGPHGVRVAIVADRN